MTAQEIGRSPPAELAGKPDAALNTHFSAHFTRLRVSHAAKP
jgi:hypothetical protein